MQNKYALDIYKRCHLMWVLSACIGIIYLLTAQLLSTVITYFYKTVVAHTAIVTVCHFLSCLVCNCRPILIYTVGNIMTSFYNRHSLCSVPSVKIRNFNSLHSVQDHFLMKVIKPLQNILVQCLRHAHFKIVWRNPPQKWGNSYTEPKPTPKCTSICTLPSE